MEAIIGAVLKVSRLQPANMMPKNSDLRKQWDLARVHAGMTVSQIARSWDVSVTAINGVLRGAVTSAALSARIQQFIRKHTPARGAR